MRVRAKKIFDGRVMKLESGGEIKEVLFNEDFSVDDGLVVDICFRDKASSGIVSLSRDEARNLCDTLEKNLKVIGKSKVLKG